MAQSEMASAVLIAMHEDILISNQVPADLTRDEALPAPTNISEEYRIGTNICVIGRAPECDIRVQGYRTDISRRHASIRPDGAIFTLYDHSTHGTYVNGKKIDGLYQLTTNDILGFANSREMLRFVRTTDDEQSAPTITDRERDILRLVALGRSNKEIALELVIAPNTVNTHLKSIYQKLEVHNRTEAVNQARKLQLL